jgi:hypothetical protein
MSPGTRTLLVAGSPYGWSAGEIGTCASASESVSPSAKVALSTANTVSIPCASGRSAIAPANGVSFLSWSISAASV